MKNANFKNFVSSGLVAVILLCSFAGNSQTRKLPDGSIVYGDGTRRLPNGTIIYKNGNNNSYPNNNSSKRLPDGSVIYPDGSRRYPNEGRGGGRKNNGNNGQWLPPGQAKKMYGGSAKDYAPGQQKKWKGKDRDDEGNDDRGYGNGHKDKD